MSAEAKKAIKRIHELENMLKNDPKMANKILEIMKCITDGNAKEVRFSALNSLRRIFCTFLESGRFVIEKNQGKDGETFRKMKEYKVWLKRQLGAYEEALCNFIRDRDNDMMAPSIRTMLEIIQREWMMTSGDECHDTKKNSGDMILSKKACFGVNAFTMLMRALCLGEKDIDIEVLLMIRNEIFSKADCRFYSWLILNRLLSEVRKDSSLSSNHVTSIVQNTIDVLRVIPYEDQDAIDDGEFLVDKGYSFEYSAGDGLDDVDSDGEIDDDEDEDEDEDYEENREEDNKVEKKRKLSQNTNLSGGEKRRKDFKKMTRAEQVVDELSHKKVFSKAWLTLLALPLTKSQHKLVLKHLPDHVVAYMANPLLLADYLTLSYECGGVTSVLALSSLFTLIVAHNLDYPDYFPSLYRLCTLENFSAKFRGKFMSLLSASLRSVNLQSYAVAAFVKRLMRLALVAPSPSALYCIAQVTWLFRNHPQCLVLLHRERTVSTKATPKGGATFGNFVDKYDSSQEVTLEKCHALQSSLWEALGLEQHYLHSVATLAKSLEAPLSTENSVRAPFLRVDDFLGHTYESLMQTELATAKKNSALAFRQPKNLLSENSTTANLFG